MSKIDPFHKRFLRFGWTSLQTIIALLGRKSRKLSVWYGGARPGDVGGPLVKVQRLQRSFPQNRHAYSVVYCLSNTPYISAFALKVLKFRKIPIVLNQNGVFYSGWFDGDWKAKNREMARAWKAADHVFCQSEFCRKCAEKFLGPRKGPTEILFNAVDVDHFKPAFQMQRDAGAPVFLMTGKIDQHMFYRVDVTLRGFAEARSKGLNARLHVSGWMDDVSQKRGKALVQELGIEEFVSFTGRYTQQEAPSIYQSGDVYIMLKHNDPCPNTVLEALACGLPVLYSNSGGVPELATGLSGLALHVEQGFEGNHVPSVAEISDGMHVILENLPARREAARQRALNAFDQKTWIARHRAVFNELSRT